MPGLPTCTGFQDQAQLANVAYSPFCFSFGRALATGVNLLQRLGEDKCYKCGEQIQTPEELSLEHKENWLHRDPALFWDLNNISFSHWRCNRPERHSGKGGKMYRKIGPVGTSWCSVHKRFLPVGQFQRNRSRWNGVH